MTPPLRIAILAPISWRTPPRHYGPWEAVASSLAEGLVKRGVDVTLFATADSRTAGRLVATAPRPFSEDPSLDPKVWECLHIARAFEHGAAGEFDLLHNHFDFLPLSYSALVPGLPVVTTIHGFSSEAILPVYQRYSGCPGHHYVAISQADRHPSLRYAATIHHGIPPLPFSPEHRGYLLFFGRIHPDKGTADAIALARAAGLPLRIAGIIQDEAYFEREVAPLLEPGRVDYLGPVGPDQRAGLLGGAIALLHLIHFDEPFGLSVAEALWCGTPVIAHRRGSMPELIREGESGFLVEEGAATPKLVALLAQAARLDRRAVRASARHRFSVERMVDDYLNLYRRILGQAPDPGEASGHSINKN